MANTLKIKRGTAATIPQGQLAEPLFTTDTYDLYIGKGSGGNQRIQNYIASGTASQFLKGDGSLDSNTYQTALTFSSPLVNTSGTVTINQSSGSVDGYLSSTDWTTFNSKEPAITAGTTLQYYRGDKTFQTLDTSVVPENGPIYFTEPRVRATVLTGLNLSGGGTIAATDSVLTAFGKVQNQISALVGGATYQGTWNASTNTPTLASGTGTKGYYYVVSVAGSTNLDGITDWKIGDWAIFNGTTWDKVDNTDAVSSVNGFTGAVNLGLDNISDVSAASPTNAQFLRFNGTNSLWENYTLTSGDIPSGSNNYIQNNATATAQNAKFYIGTGNRIDNSTNTDGIYLANSGIGNGYRVANSSTGSGIVIDNSSGGTGLLVGNTSTGSGIVVDNSTAATGYLFRGAKNAVNKILMDDSGNITAASYIKSGGTSSQFLKADGSVDSNTYLTTSSASSTYLPLAGGTLTGALNATSASFNSTIQSGGDYRFAFGFPTIKWDSGSLSFYSTGGALYPLTLASNGEVIIGESGSSSPLVGVIRGSDGVGTNIAGAELRLITGRGTGSAVGGDFVVQISPAGTSGSTGNAASPVFELGNSKVRFNRLTTNGFLKTSSANGTVTVDTTSYLPLTGGTITGNLVVNGNIALIATTGFPTVGFLHRATDNILYAKMPSGGFAFSDSLNNINLSISSSGALSGTSATFSDILAESKTADGIIQTIGGNSTKANIYQFSSGGLAGGVFNIGHNFYYDGTNYGQGNAAKSGWVISSNLNADTFSIGRAAAGSTSAPTTILSFASTGAATFSSSVTTGDAFYLGASGNGGGTWTWGGSDAYIYSPTGKNLWLSSGVTGVNGLKIGTTGAATFSSSVTATSGLFSSSSSTNLTIERTGSNGVFVGLKDGSGNFAYIGNNNGDFLVQTPSGSYSTKLTILNGGNVGIGTTNPNVYGNGFTNQFTVSTTSGYANITVAGSSGNSGGIDFGNQTVRHSGIYALDGSNLAFYTNGSNSGSGLTERMRITSGGNVGIGVTPSAWNLGSPVIEMGTGVHFFGAGIQAQMGSNNYYNGTNYIYKSTNYATRYIQNNGIHSWEYAASGTAGNAITFNEAMRITTGGNIEATGSIKTGTTSTGNASAFKIGNRIVNTCTVSTSAYLEIEVAGTLYYLAFANPS